MLAQILLLGQTTTEILCQQKFKKVAIGLTNRKEDARFFQHPCHANLHGADVPEFEQMSKENKC
jgi:hypothetical protein